MNRLDRNIYACIIGFALNKNKTLLNGEFNVWYKALEIFF